MYDLRCLCGEFIVKSYSATGKTKIRSKVIFVQDGVVKAVCRGCNLEHSIPLVFDDVLAKSLGHKSYSKRLTLKRDSNRDPVVVRKRLLTKDG